MQVMSRSIPGILLNPSCCSRYIGKESVHKFIERMLYAGILRESTANWPSSSCSKPDIIRNQLFIIFKTELREKKQTRCFHCVRNSRLSKWTTSFVTNTKQTERSAPIKNKFVLWHCKNLVLHFLISLLRHNNERVGFLPYRPNFADIF